MKYIKIKYLIICLLLFSGCEKLVEIDPPQDFLISETIFKSDETAISATTGIYATMMKTDYPIPYNIALFSGMYSDELDYKLSGIGLLSLYKYSLFAQDAVTNPMWNNGFNYIYQANAIIEGLNKSSEVSQSVKNQLLGEAMFIRAFWNFYLSNLYGPLPIVTSTDYEANSILSRESVERVQQQIISDLVNSKQLLSEKYVSGNSISESVDRIRPNTFVASALLARLYLQRKEYQKADEEATRIISSNKYHIASNLSLVFKRNSKEVIWQLELPANTNYNNSYEASMFMLTAKPNPSGNSQSTTLTVNLLSLFDVKDKRRDSWIGTYIDSTVTPAVRYIFSSKYKNRFAPADEYTTPFRIAEMYLIRAESRLQNGRINDAIVDLDKIRSRAGLELLEDITPSISTQALQDSIINEKRRELFCEWGLRWFDIKRSDNSDQIMKSIAAEKDAGWKATALVWPLPLNEILNSANKLKQNDGYN